MEAELFACPNRGAEQGTWDCGCSGQSTIFACSHPDNANGQCVASKPARQCGKPKWEGWACSTCLFAEAEGIRPAVAQAKAPSRPPKTPQELRRQALLNKEPTLSDAAIRRSQGVGAGAHLLQKSSKLRWISSEQRIRDTRRLMGLLPPDTSVIIGVARSGLAPAAEIAMAMHLPLWVLDQETRSIVPAGNGWRLKDARSFDGPMVAIDDSCATGRSMALGKLTLQEHPLTRGKQVKWATLYTNPGNPKQPDIFAVACPDHHLFEWNFANSIYSARTAWDIDGAIVTENPDMPGLAKLLPRRSTIPLIVTGRREYERKSTEAMLRKFGLVWNRLEMLPDDADTKIPMAYSRHKARHYAGSNLDWFVESCPIQAKEIAVMTRKVVICPTTSEVF